MLLPVTCVISGKTREFTLRDFQARWEQNKDRTLSDYQASKIPRSYSQEAVQRARRNLRRIVASNDVKLHKGDKGRPQFVTFTFAEPVEDIERVKREWQLFLKRLRRSPLGTFNLRYIAVPEIQREREQKTGKAVWHIHAVFFGVAPLDRTYDLWRNLWGNGLVNVKQVKARSATGVSLYLAKYLGKDMVASGRRLYWRGGNLLAPVVYGMQLMDLVAEMYEDCVRECTRVRSYEYEYGGIRGKVVWFGY